MQILDFRFWILDWAARLKRSVTVAVAILLFAVLSNAFADVKGEMDSLANQARHAADKFMQQTVELRLGYEYRQGFASDAQAQSLRELAKNAATELEDILLKQAKIKKQIENYNGEDWDSRYGDSGVWRMLSADICNTTILRCRIEYFQAAASVQYEQAKILKSSLDQLSTLPETINVLLAKADIYALQGRTDQSAKKLAGELYRKILAAQKAPDEVYYPAALAAQKLNPPQSSQVLDELAARLERSECRDNFEINMTLAFLQRRLGSTAILEKTLKRWPQARTFVGDLVLSDLTGQSPPQLSRLSALEADCAAAAALQNEPAKYRDLLESLSQVGDFQTARVLCAAAIAESQNSPSKAIELFIKASLVRREPNDSYEPPGGIARQGAVLALSFFKSEPAKCELVKRALANYFTLAGGAVDEQIEYSYADVLSDCSETAAATKLLQKIAAKDNSEFRQRAKLDLLTMAISRENSPQARAELAEQLSELIRASDTQQQVCADAKILYCRVMLDANSPEASQKVITVLETAPALPQRRTAVLKSQALFQLGRLPEAAKALVAADVNICDCKAHALNLLMRYADKIDEYADSDSTVDMFYQLGRQVLDCSDDQSRQHAAILYAQTAIAEARGQADKLDTVEKLLNSLDKAFGENSMDVLTARATLAAARGNHEEAARRWGTICGILKGQPNEPPQHSWHWWQAKYFELENSLRVTGASRADIIHSIEVLQSSFNQIPPFWDKKLKALAASR